MKELEARLEAVLFAAGDAVSVERLSKALGVKSGLVYAAAESLSNYYDFERRGIVLVRMEDKLQLASRPDYAEDIRRATESRRPPALGPAALEVLTIVAYRQPVTRAFVEQLRGVDSGATVTSLADKGLIEESGRLDVPGRPILYRTTDAFLRAFSITSLSELPALPALQTENEQLTLDDLAERAEAANEEAKNDEAKNDEAPKAGEAAEAPETGGIPEDESGEASGADEEAEEAETGEKSETGGPGTDGPHEQAQ